MEANVVKMHRSLQKRPGGCWRWRDGGQESGLEGDVRVE